MNECKGRNPSARGTRPKRGPRGPGGPRPEDAHQREEVGVTVLEAGAVGGGVGVPVAVAVGRVAHGGDPVGELIVVGAVKAAVCGIRGRGGVILL